jgi:hypothetical protein
MKTYTVIFWYENGLRGGYEVWVEMCYLRELFYTGKYVDLVI